jgi:hypothetical protein
MILYFEKTLFFRAKQKLKNIAVYTEPGLTWHTSGQQLSLTDICYIVF